MLDLSEFKHKIYQLKDKVAPDHFRKMEDSLFTPRYSELSLTAKNVYMVLQNRTSLSQKHPEQYLDSNGVFVEYTREKIATALQIDKSTVIRACKDLVNFGLIIEEKTGMSNGKPIPNKIYVCKVDNQTTKIIKKRKILSSSSRDDKPEESIEKSAKNHSERESECNSFEVSKCNALRVSNCNSSKTNNTKTEKNELIFSNEKIVSHDTYREMSQKSSKTTSFSLSTSSVEKAKPNSVKRALQDIEDAKSGVLSWDSIKSRDFTYYFITQHNAVMADEIVVELKSSQVPNMKAFIEHYELPKEKVCEYLDELVLRYSEHIGKKRKSLSLPMLGQNYKIIKEIMRDIEVKFDFAKGRKVLTEDELAEKARLSELYKDEIF